MKENDMPAFPRAHVSGQLNDSQDGMTLRDYFAASALNGLLSYYSKNNNVPDGDWMATESYKYADALLKERIK